MAFGPFEQRKFPIRQWSLIAPARYGKSTLAGNMKQPMVVIDTDNRFATTMATLGLSPSQAMPISNDREVHVLPKEIAAQLAANQNGGVGTILLDSITGIIQPMEMAAMDVSPKERGAKMLGKAAAMRTIIDALQNFGSDYVLIWHQENRRDNQGEKIIHETLPPTEKEALYRALNMESELVVEKNKDGTLRHGVTVVWARDGEDGMTIWDEPGNCFRGMPERIEEAVYKNGINAAPRKPAAGNGSPGPQPRFDNRDAAVEYGVMCGAYATIEAAGAAYAAVRLSTQAATAHAMFEAWHSHCEARARLSRQPISSPATADG